MDLSRRTRSRECDRALGGSDGGEPEVIGRGPKPNSLFAGWIIAQSDQNVILPAGSHVTGSIIRRGDDLHVFALYGEGKVDSGNFAVELQ